jgi:hypothetical protein
MRYGRAIFLVVVILFASEVSLTASNVSTVKLPDSAFRTQVVMDAKGTIHMVHANLQKELGNLYYVRKEAGQEAFSAPIQVNSTANCSAGFNMAVGKDGRVHVVIRPNAKYSMAMLKRKPKFNDLKYMLYCRLNDESTKFEEERDLSDATFGFEGVGAIIADGKGEVSVFWHGLEEPGPEHTRSIFVARSANEGRSFTKPERIQSDVIGACACCSMSGTMDIDGRMYLVYRNSESTANKDSYLLVSDDKGRTFTGTLLESWANAGCPGSRYSIASGPSGVFVAWDTQGRVRFAKSGSKINSTDAPANGKKTRSPILVCNSKGEVLFAWSEADEPRQFMKGGDLAWRVYDRNGNPVSEKQVLSAGVGPRWSMPTAYATPDGDFVVLYDGAGSINK